MIARGRLRLLGAGRVAALGARPDALDGAAAACVRRHLHDLLVGAPLLLDRLEVLADLLLLLLDELPLGLLFALR